MCDRPISVKELARVVPRHFLYIDISLSLCEGAENDCLAAENHSQGPKERLCSMYSSTAFCNLIADLPSGRSQRSAFLSGLLMRTSVLLFPQQQEIPVSPFRRLLAMQPGPLWRRSA